MALERIGDADGIDLPKRFPCRASPLYASPIAESHPFTKSK